MAIPKSAASTPPIMTPVLEPPAVPVDPESAADLAVDEGMAAREDGESLPRQLESSEKPTSFTSELPPVLPFASVIVNRMDVPAETSAIQLKNVGPFVGLMKNACPPGIIA